MSDSDHGKRSGTQRDAAAGPVSPACITAAVVTRAQRGRRARTWFRFVTMWKRIGARYARDVLGSEQLADRLLAERHRLEMFPGHVLRQVVEHGRLEGLELLGAPEGWRPLEGTPRTRSDCPTEKPCRYVMCKFNLMLIAAEDRPGTRRPTHRMPLPLVRWGSGYSCCLDFIDDHPDGTPTCDAVGAAMGVSGERIMQNTNAAIEKIQAQGFDARGWAEVLADERASRSGTRRRGRME